MNNDHTPGILTLTVFMPMQDNTCDDDRQHHTFAHVTSTGSHPIAVDYAIPDGTPVSLCRHQLWVIDNTEQED